MQLRVFYIDDEAMLLQTFKSLFGSDDVDIETFVDPYLALKESQKNPPDLIFIDYRLPGITGDQVALQLPKDLPKFLVSGDHKFTSQEMFVTVLEKPYNIDEIQEIINKYKKK